MNKSVTLATVALTLIASPVLAGDPVTGQREATTCMVCHGNEHFGGIFYTLQLGGRNADKLLVKSIMYKTRSKLQPVMNLVTAFYSVKELEDITAYYQALGKPAFTSRFFTIQGDEEAAADHMTPPLQAVSYTGKWTSSY